MRFKIKNLLWFILLFQLVFAQPGYQVLTVGVHFDSKVSKGKYTLQELAQILARSNLDAAIITDHDNMEVSYGVPLFENIVKFTFRDSSIRTYGEAKYLRKIAELDQRYPGIILIPGIEAVPFYYWEGSLLSRSNPLVIRQWHEHLLVLGLDTPEEYKNLPSVPAGLYVNPFKDGIIKGLEKHLRYYFLLVVYLFLFLYGIVLFFGLKRRKSRRKSRRHRRKKRKVSRTNRIIGLFFILFFGLLFINQYPFLPRVAVPIKGPQGTAPYQLLVDYVNAHGGMVFWAHPEVAHRETLKVKLPFMEKKIVMDTKEYSGDLLQTENYTGFAIFMEGMVKIGKPGGYWDKLLMEYLVGYRENPIWALGELDFEGENNIDVIEETLTHVFVKERSAKAILEALRNGRMYATRNFAARKMKLLEFSISDDRSRKTAFMGETLLTNGTPVINIRLQTLKPRIRDEIQLIRNGKVIRRFPFSGDTKIRFVDSRAPQKDLFYRILIGKNWVTLASNPIFIRRQ